MWTVLKGPCCGILQAYPWTCLFTITFEFQSVLRDFSKKELDWKVSFIPMLKKNVCSCWLILTTCLYFNQDEIESKGAMVFDYGDLICDPGRRNILYYWLNFTASEQQCTFWFQHLVKHLCCTFSINIYLGFIVLRLWITISKCEKVT